MEFELGKTYSGYKFLDVIARTRTTVTYRVQNTLAQRVEVLTALPAGARDDQDAAERLVREMRIRARLTHPHIITFFTALPLEGQLVMTTELFEGMPLAERLQLGPLPWTEALDGARQILSAAGAGHDQQVVHRDITPANILCGPDGVWKLTNFSLACQLNNGDGNGSGSMVGNPRYVSPEQVKGASELDQRSDLYSIGAVLYEMLCGRPPFDSKSHFELMLAHVNQKPAAPSEVLAKVPASLDAIVMKALEKDPAARYQSAAEFAESLATPRESAAAETVVVAAHEPVVEVAVVVETPVAEPEPVVEAAAAPVAETAPAVETPAAEPEPAPVVAAPEPVAEAAPAVETPVAEPEPAPVVAAPEAVAEAAPVAETPAAEPEPTPVVAAPEPVAEAAPVVETPVAEPEPAPVVAAPETVAEAPPVVETPAAEPVPEPVVAAPEPVAEAAPAEATPVAEPEPAPVVAAPETVAEALPVVETPAAEPVPEPVVAAPEPVAEVAPLVETPVAEPEPVPVVAAPEPVAEVAPVVETPVAEPEPVPVVAAPEPVAEAAPVAETPAAEPEPVLVAAAVAVDEPSPVAPVVETPAVEPEPVLVAAAVAVAEPQAVEPEPVLVAAAVAEPVAAGLEARATVVSTNGHTAHNGHGNGNLQANLWEAAKIVAEAATAPAAVIEPMPAPVPVQLAAAPAVTPPPAQPMMANGSAARAGLTPAVPPLPVATPPVNDESTNYNIPAFIASSRKHIDGVKWVIFGSTAAFLGIIWAAIYFTVGK